MTESRDSKIVPPLPSDISGVKLLPYCEVDGIRTFKDSEIGYLFALIQKEDKIESLFSDGSVQSELDLISLFKRDNRKLWIVSYKDKIKGLVWLSDFCQATACVHFVSFDTDISLLKIAQQSIRQLIYMKDINNQYIFSVLTGVISEKNTKAIKFTEKMGLSFIGKIPNALYDYYKQTYYGGMLFSATRGD